eukprot:PRCOL_00006076-RA
MALRARRGAPRAGRAACAAAARSWPLIVACAAALALVAAYRLSMGAGGLVHGGTGVDARRSAAETGGGADGMSERADERSPRIRGQGGRGGGAGGIVASTRGDGGSDLDSGGNVRVTQYSDWLQTVYPPGSDFDVAELLPNLMPLQEKHKAWEGDQNNTFFRVLRPAAVDALHDKLKAAENRRDGDPEPPAVWTYAGQAGNAFIDGREDNMAKFKPGVYDMKFVFSSNNAKHTVRTPYWYEWESVLRPVIESVLGKGACERLIRLQLAYMTPGAQIFHHRDTGRWVKDAHRVHIPLEVNPHTRFQVKLHADDDEWVQVPLERGRSFEINNNFMHRVFNDGEEYRTHLLVDLGEERRTYIDLKPGEHCVYDKLNKRGVCH